MLAAFDVRLEAARPQADLVDRRLGEGAAADRSLIDTAVRDAVIDGLDEADDEITEILAAPRKGEVVDHWRNMGGIVPPDVTMSR